MAKEAKKTIFFTAGMAPTAEEYKAAEGIGSGVVFRNASKVVPGAPLENCDAVAGAVPDDYQEVYSKSEKEQSFVRPKATRLASSGGPDDVRPGTIDSGIKHESGTGSTPTAQRREQRAGQNVWDKQPQDQTTTQHWPSATETGRSEPDPKQEGKGKGSKSN